MDNIFLTGFMGTGKTVVGRALAGRLGRPFVDTDAEIEHAVGMRIRDIFGERGEAEFRTFERAALERACWMRGAVVATGGGMIVDPENRGRMRAAGRIVCLTASADVILERIGEDEDRPLLAGASDRRARVREILAGRAEAYAAADWTVDTSGRAPAEVAEAIAEWLTRMDRASAR